MAAQPGSRCASTGNVGARFSCRQYERDAAVPGIIAGEVRSFARVPTHVSPSSLLQTLGLLVAIAVSTMLSVAHAMETVQFGPHDVRSVFYVSKSENDNQVHYALRLDAACRPVGERPVFAYWRRMKGSARVDAPLVSPGTHVYGASDNQAVQRTAEGGRVQMFVKALDRVRIDVTVTKLPTGECQALATTTLHGSKVRLSHAFLQLGAWGLRVKYVDVFGARTSDGKQVSQRFD